MPNLFEQFDELIEYRNQVLQYANSLCRQLHEAEARAAKKIITTLGYDLGIACPSLIQHVVIKGHKKGRIIKKIPEKDNYRIISYDEEGKPIAFRSGNQFGVQNAYFFFSYEDCLWAAEMNENGCTSYTKLYRMKYNEKGQISSFYILENYFLEGEEYTYSESENEPIICMHYFYVPNKVHTSKHVPAGYAESPTTLYRYVIHENTIDSYVKSGEEFHFMKTFRRTKAKWNIPTEKQFALQLDEILHKAESLQQKGIYFELHEGNDQEYIISVNMTPNFDAQNEDWACETETELGEINLPEHVNLTWQEIQNTAVQFVQNYLKNGTHRNKLFTCAGIGVGFPEGDLMLISE